MQAKTALLINLDANEGRAGSKWRRIKKDVESAISGPVLIQAYTIPFPMRPYLEKVIKSHQIRSFIIGGGDGTVHHFIQCLSKVVGRHHLSKFVLGVIGLGSSNDFTKPARMYIKGIPVKINADQQTLEDLGLVKIYQENGAVSKQIFCANSGIGIIAEANYKFNNPNKTTAFLKTRSTALSIIWTAFSTIMKYHNQDLYIEHDQCKSYLKTSNLSVTLSPYISGSFHYKRSRAKKGFFDLFVCRNMSKIKLLQTLILLTKGKFDEGEYRVVEAIQRLSVSSSELIPLEADGEIYLGYRFEFSVLTDCIQVMN